MDLQREPFRLFFPLGILLGWAGVLPWFLFGVGATHVWPGFYHALTMTQGFLVALAVGFLGTMLPRRTKGRPFSWVEMGIMLLALCTVPIALWKGSLLTAELAFATVLGTLLQYAARAVRSAGPMPRGHASFVWIPIAMLLGLGGTVLLCVFALAGTPPWALSLGRQLAQQGLMLGLVLGLTPMLAPIIATGDPAPELPPAAAQQMRRFHGLMAMALLASFLLEEFIATPAGLLLRAAVCTTLIARFGGPWRGGLRPGLHRVLFRAALWFIPLGLLCAGLMPLHRAQWLHLTYVGGFAMLAFAVSVHVTLMHTGREREASGRPTLVMIAAALMLAAAAVRLSADRLAGHYVAALTTASALWLCAGLVWGLFVLLRVRAPAIPT